MSLIETYLNVFKIFILVEIVQIIINLEEDFNSNEHKMKTYAKNVLVVVELF